MSDRLKNAFINKYKTDQPTEKISVVQNSIEVEASDDFDEVVYEDKALNSFAPSLLIAILIIVTAIIIFSASNMLRVKNNDSQLAETIKSSQNDHPKVLSDQAADFESVTFLKVKFFDGLETYDMSLPLTLQDGNKRNIIVGFKSSISLSKKKLVVDIGPTEGPIDLILKDSSLQSNNFNPFVIKPSSERQIIELSINSLPKELIADVNLYRISELRLKLDKAGTVTINSVSLQ